MTVSWMSSLDAHGRGHWFNPSIALQVRLTFSGSVQSSLAALARVAEECFTSLTSQPGPALSASAIQKKRESWRSI